MSTKKQERNTSAIMPPYLSVSKLAQLINLISTRNFTELKSNDLTHYGFGETDSYIAITALRFLGLLNEENKAEDSIKKFHLQGPPKQDAIKTIVQQAYSAIFQRVPNPMNLDNDELFNEFLVTYGITPRVARTAVPAFVWLCEQAGLKEPTEKASTPKTSKKVDKNSSATTKIKTPANSTNSNTLNFTFKGGIQLLIPNIGHEITTALAQGELKSISDEITKFAEKYFESK